MASSGYVYWDDAVCNVVEDLQQGIKSDWATSLVKDREWRQERESRLTVPKLTRTAYYPLTVICATEGGTVSGTGVYAEGKKVTVKATVAKGYVFAGGVRDGGGGEWRRSRGTRAPTMGRSR